MQKIGSPCRTCCGPSPCATARTVCVRYFYCHSDGTNTQTAPTTPAPGASVTITGPDDFEASGHHGERRQVLL